MRLKLPLHSAIWGFCPRESTCRLTAAPTALYTALLTTPLTAYCISQYCQSIHLTIAEGTTKNTVSPIKSVYYRKVPLEAFNLRQPQL